jgi:hypothetical protein
VSAGIDATENCAVSISRIWVPAAQATKSFAVSVKLEQDKRNHIQKASILRNERHDKVKLKKKRIHGDFWFYTPTPSFEETGVAHSVQWLCYWMDDSWFESRQVWAIYFFSKTPRPILAPHPASYLLRTGDYLRGVKWRELEADQLTRKSVVADNDWIYTSTLICSLITCVATSWPLALPPCLPDNENPSIFIICICLHQILGARPIGKRGRGCPRKTREDVIEELGRRKGDTMREMDKLAKDRKGFNRWTEHPDTGR